MSFEEKELPVLFEVRRYREDSYDYGSYKINAIEVKPPDQRVGYGQWKPIQSTGRDVPRIEHMLGYFELIVIWRAKPSRSR